MSCRNLLQRSDLVRFSVLGLFFFLPWNPLLAQEKDFEFFGDLRFRSENNRAADGSATHRFRYRARWGLHYDVSEEIRFGARLSTGGQKDPRSPHQDFGDLFRSFEFGLDCLYLEYQPNGAGSWTFRIGKLPHTIYRNPIYGELVLDADIQPEGFYARKKIEGFGPFAKAELVGGLYLFEEGGPSTDRWMTYFQGATSTEISNLGFLDNALSFTHLDGPPHSGEDFAALHSIAAFKTNSDRLPLTVATEYFLNLCGRSGQRAGWSVGTAVGSEDSKGDWRLFYQWSVVGRDAVSTSLAQDDFLLTAGHSTHLIGLGYLLAEDVGLRLSTSSTKAIGWPNRHRAGMGNGLRIRLDLEVRF